MVENMITPADFARMLRQTPDSADNRTQDQLLYTSETPRHSADSSPNSRPRDPSGGARPTSAATESADDDDVAKAADSASHPSRSSIIRPASQTGGPTGQPMMRPTIHPTPATVFGVRATVTIATANGTIEGQAEGIAGETGAIAAALATGVPIEDADTAVPGNPAAETGGSPVSRETGLTGSVGLDGLDDLNELADLAEPSASPTLTVTSAAATSAAATTVAAGQIAISGPTPATVFGRLRHAGITYGPGTSVTEDGARRVLPTADSDMPSSAQPPAPVQTPSGPTPAMMPQRRASDGPTTFASLDAQELPVVREYSAGGLIFDKHNRVAIIARHSRSGHLEWCLPKGHIEKGETPQQTAVREVHEETGILGEVIDSIATIDYWFTGTTQRVHKLVHHFALRQTGGELTVEGDPDHEAEDAIWVRFDDLDDVLSYPNERKIAWLYARKKNRQANE